MRWSHPYLGQSHTTWASNPKGLIIQHGTLIRDCFPEPTQTFATTWLQPFAAAELREMQTDTVMQTRDAGRVQQFTQRLARHVCVAVNSVRARLLLARNKVFRSAEERERTGARQQQVICRQETRLDDFFFILIIFTPAVTKSFSWVSSFNVSTFSHDLSLLLAK